MSIQGRGALNGATATLGVGVLGDRPALEDSFTRANSATSLGTADSGQAWTAITATFGISSKKGYIAANSGLINYAFIDSGLLNFTMEADVLMDFAGGDWRWSGLVFRADGTTTENNIFFAGGNEAGVDKWALYKRVANVATEIDSTVEAITEGNTYKLKVITNGNDISCYVDGVLKASGSEANLNTNSKQGLYQGQITAGAVRWDNFYLMGH